MPKRIAICFDGTWNSPSHHAELEQVAANHKDRESAWFDSVDPMAGPETNVCRLYRSIRKIVPEDVGAGSFGQVKWYDKGVGTDWYDRLPGGAFGVGLSRNIRQGYKAIVDRYDDGDEIFVFGFSRGAYTARSLVGLIRNCGLLPKDKLPSPEADDNPLLIEAYELYRTRDEGPDSERAIAFRAQHGAKIVPIKFLGVWDTVGALGIPVESFAGFNKALFSFHDTELSGIVQNACHAIAVDEHREPYAATLFDPKQKPSQTIEQRWFLGAHCDVGGGYDDRRLSDLALRWMQDKAKACGLEMDPAGTPELDAAVSEASIHDSFKEFLNGLYHVFHARYYRGVGFAQYGAECVDGTVADRLRKDLNYRPRNRGLQEKIAAVQPEGEA